MSRTAAVPRKTSTVRLASLCRNISLALAGCLPFLSPFDPARNVDFQGLLLIISGVFAWSALLSGYREPLKALDRLSRVLLGIFVVSCVLSLLVNAHFGYDFFGAPYIRLGAGGLLSCIGIGLLATTLRRRQLLAGLYALIATLGLVSVPYSWLHIHSLLRMGGLFAQADIFACFLGVGLLLGFHMLGSYPRRRFIILAYQILLFGLLLLTQTRAVLLLASLVGLVWILQLGRGKVLKPTVIYLAAVLVLFLGLHYIVPNRLTNTGYASQSLHYRLVLQGDALRASGHKPVFGYGPGNLADALDCSRLKDGSLQKTCGEGYFFNSSHNIFIDRVLAIGWLGGLSYIAIVGLAVYRGLRGNRESRVFSYALVLIAGYYVTNVTSLTLELLLWIMSCAVLVYTGLYQKSSTDK